MRNNDFTLFYSLKGMYGEPYWKNKHVKERFYQTKGKAQDLPTPECNAFYLPIVGHCLHKVERLLFQIKLTII
jgi:hypothetical protein